MAAPIEPLQQPAAAVVPGAKAGDEKAPQVTIVDVTQLVDAETETRGWRFYGSFFSLCLGTFIVAMDATIISVALPVSSLLLRFSSALHKTTQF